MSAHSIPSRVANNGSLVQPTLLGKINERQLLRVIQNYGPSSRAELTRRSGISAPTVSKAVSSLLEIGFLEESHAPELMRGRPAKKLRLASRTAQVLGIVVDANECRVVSAGLDGKIDSGLTVRFKTPTNYQQLIDEIESAASTLIKRVGVTTLGIGISLPGLVDYSQKRSILSPNVPVTNNHSLSNDLHDRLGIECVMLQETHTLCLAERYYGLAKGLDDFALLDISTGVGLGVMSGGRLLKGHQGFAGEIGHLTVAPEGRQCGCGNRGCFETVASDSALVWAVSQHLGRKISFDEICTLVQNEDLQIEKKVDEVCEFLSIGLACVLNLFNPSTLIIHGRLFELGDHILEKVVNKTKARALRPPFETCSIIQAQGSKSLGAVTGIIEFLTSTVAPEIY